jgi:hypothetical protein
MGFMSVTNRVYDRVESFLGGMNSFLYPADLPVNQSKLLQNMIVLDSGRAVTRPGANQIDSTPSTFTNINPTGIVQGLGFVDNFTNGQLILLAEGGKLYTWNGSEWSSALSFTLTNATSSVPTIQGMDKLLISDGVQAMRLWDGVNFIAQGTGILDTSATDAPTGATILTFIAGMFVVTGPAMVMGNGSGGTTSYPPDTLMFSNYINVGTGLPSGQTVTAGVGSGGWLNTNSFRVGNGDGEPIVALAVLQATASVYPSYNLAVLKSNSVWVVNISPQSYPSSGGGYFANMFAAFAATPQGDQIGQGIGCVGAKAFCLYQNDLLFMSPYGVQSLQRMQAAAGQYQLITPLSQPIQSYIDQINWSMAYNIQAIHYKQYAIFFVPLGNSTTNNYALVWDGFLGRWMIWTGWTPECAVVTRFSEQVQFVFGDSNGNVNQWQDANEFYGLDSTYFDNGTPIPWEILTRSFTFKDLESLKKMKAVLVRFNAGNATVNFSAYFDLAPNDAWQDVVAPSGAILGVTTILPFVLGSLNPVVCYRSELGEAYFNEFWLSISASTGWADVRNVLGIAYKKYVRDETA